MDMKKRELSLFKSSLIASLLLLNSCLLEQKPSFDPTVQFTYFGSRNGTFVLFSQYADTSSRFTMYGGGPGDSSTKIYAIRWGSGRERADIAIISLKGTLSVGEIFSNDSSSFHCNAVIGFSTPVTVTHGLNEDVYSLPDSTSFTSSKFTFSILQYDASNSGTLLTGPPLNL
jgi:hypothetical protein